MNSVSVVITSAYEPQTIGRAVRAILNQDFKELLEILIVAPDEDTLKAAQKTAKGHPKVKLLQDSGAGKPVALNLAFTKAQGEIFVLTDGDVNIATDALSPLLKPFRNSQVGGTGGQPISVNNRNAILGFWSHFLTEAAHKIRQDRNIQGKFIELSGYLLAIRKSLILPIPKKTLADDLYLSHLVTKANLKTVYVPEAKVLVKYPTTITDWFKQKRRSAFEYWQNPYSSNQKMRTPFTEIFQGLSFALTYPKNLKEIIWLILLFAARIFLWLQITLLHLKPPQNLWQKVKTTK